MTVNEWGSMTRKQLGRLAAEKALVIIPTGAIEQHGDHLRVDTDTRLSTSVARLAAERTTSVPVVLGPSVAMGFSPHHAAWAGTITLRLETYIALLTDIARSILDTGFSRVLFVNGHGGNEAPLRSVVTQMVTDGHPVGMINYFQPSIREWTEMLQGALPRAGHACEQETALLLAIPETDEAERQAILAAANNLPPRTVQPWMAPGAEIDPITTAGAGWPPIFQEDDCGYYGDPAAANQANGDAILEVTVARLAEFYAAFAKAPLRLGARQGFASPAGNC